jgi:hypothetical protein
MTPRYPDIGETGLSPSEAAYLSPTFARHDESIDYGKTPSNTVSRMLERTEHEWQTQCFQPAVRPLRGEISTAAGKTENATQSRLGSVGKESFRLGQVWLRGESNTQAAGSEVLGLEVAND